VQRLLASAEGLRPLAQSLARGEAGALSLAFVSTADYGLLPLLLRDFGARHPRVRLELTEATSDVQVDELVAGRIDAGLVIAPLPSRHATQLSWLPIAREPPRGPRQTRAPSGWTRRLACATSPTRRS
jgi:DNA-binding transcriptional LysR family regulator